MRNFQTRSLRPKRWVFYPQSNDIQVKLERDLGVKPLTACLLANRNIGTSKEAAEFLSPDVRNLADPFEMTDMDKATQRVREAIYNREKVLVHGDYDVDGVTGTSLLYHFLRQMNVNAQAFIPHRIDDGYSLQKKNIEKFKQDGITLLITVDCGTTNIDEIAFAQSLGIDVIVTDHHTAPTQLPPAFAVLNPRRAEATYRFKGLCGAGMTFKLACGIAEALSPQKKQSPELAEFFSTGLALASIGTIADVVPLVSENRIIVTHGLEAIRHSTNPGLRALIEGANLSDKELTVEDIAFRIAPKINAAGRMGSGYTAFQLLTCDNILAARELDSILEQQNQMRKEVEKAIEEEAIEQIESKNLDRYHVIVLSSNTWHPGVVGIVAARIAERYHRPAIVIAIRGKAGRGSGRSVPHFPLYDVMCKAGHLCISFGGHSQAAGLEIEEAKVPEFREAINQAAAEAKDVDLNPFVQVDREVSLDQITLPTLQEIMRLAPFGQSNPAPIFAARGVRAAGSPRLVGQNNNHLLLYAVQNNVSHKAVGFHMSGHHKLVSSGFFNMLFTPKISLWSGSPAIELEIKDLQPISM